VFDIHIKLVDLTSTFDLFFLKNSGITKISPFPEYDQVGLGFFLLLLLFILMTVLGFELRALHLLGRCSTT
jgi:hypothetical protein